jgi:RNA polymerase sporulation-specific sigma factor
MTLVLNSASEFSDDDLVLLARQGQVDALNLLLDRYRRFARAKARCYFLAGGDVDDIEQEGLIGLYKAVRDFRAERQASFRAFAELCITRQIITAIKTATRHKHRPLNSYVSLWGVGTLDEAGERLVEGLLDQQVADPADEIVSDECLSELRDLLARLLSGLEVDVLRLYVEGRSYQEISEELGRHVKSIDNALQRIKRKLEAHLDARGEDDDGAPAVAVA